MSVATFFQERVHFGKGIPAPINALLQEAAGNTHNFTRAEQLLRQAQRLAPEQLPVYTALYKLYFYNGYTDQAEDVVFQALTKAALTGGFCYDWTKLQPHPEWADPDSAGRAYLYSLKALAFIRLRQDNPKSAKGILDTLRRLDPDDVIGADVVRALAISMDDDDE